MKVPAALTPGPSPVGRARGVFGNPPSPPAHLPKGEGSFGWQIAPKISLFYAVCHGSSRIRVNGRCDSFFKLANRAC